LQELVREFNEAEQARQEKGLPAEAFAAYRLLNRANVQNPDAAGSIMADAVQRFPHWSKSAEQQRGLRKELYKSLLAAGVAKDKLAEFARQIMKLIEGALSEQG